MCPLSDSDGGGKKRVPWQGKFVLDLVRVSVPGKELTTETRLGLGLLGRDGLGMQRVYAVLFFFH